MTKPWQMNGVKGVYHFLQRVWRLSVDVESNQLSEDIVDACEPSIEWLTALHQTIHKVTEDIESLKFNTAIAQMMSFLNLCKAEKQIPKAQWALFH